MLRRDRLEAAGIPERYRECTFENFWDTSAPLTVAKRHAREFVDYYPVVPAGLLVLGPSGRGKTHLACAILSALVADKGRAACTSTFRTSSSGSRRPFVRTPTPRRSPS